jgi:hypothetical protein
VASVAGKQHATSALHQRGRAGQGPSKGMLSGPSSLRASVYKYVVSVDADRVGRMAGQGSREEIWLTISICGAHTLGNDNPTTWRGELEACPRETDDWY